MLWILKAKQIYFLWVIGFFISAANLPSAMIYVYLVGTVRVKSRRCALMDVVYIIPKNVCRTLGLNNEEEDHFFSAMRRFGCKQP